MKIYSPKKGTYALPNSVYYRVIYLVKDYPRLLSEADALLEATPPQTETPEIQRQRNIKATETTNIKYSMMMKDVRDIEEALIDTVPPDARNAIMKSIICGASYPVDKGRSTYAQYKQRFLYTLAERRHLI